MGTLEKQRELIERKISVVNLLKSVIKFSDDRLRDPKDHSGVAKEVQDMVTFTLGGMIKRIEGVESVKKPADAITQKDIIESVNGRGPISINNAKGSSSSLGNKRKKSEFAKRHANLANKVFTLKTTNGVTKAKVVALDEPNVVVKIEGTDNLIRVPVELVELSGEQ